jgi:hypothetical protein
MKHLRRQANLVQVVLALHRASGFTRGLDRRQQ